MLGDASRSPLQVVAADIPVGTLAALAPQFSEKLPHDIINGQPLHYRREADGRFVLYSIGWNEKDDGGQVILTPDRKPSLDQGDWVWPPPAK